MEFKAPWMGILVIVEPEWTETWGGTEGSADSIDQSTILTYTYYGNERVIPSDGYQLAVR